MISLTDDPLQLALAMLTACYHQDEAFVAELMNGLEFRKLAEVLAAAIGLSLGLATEIVDANPDVPDMDSFLQALGLNILTTEQ